MQVDYMIGNSIVEYPELARKIFFTPLNNLAVKKDVTKEAYEAFKKEQLNTEAQAKFYNLHMFDDMSRLKRKFHIYFYYIPADIYPYVKYESGHVMPSKEIPSDLSEKFKNCIRYLEIELNYMDRIEKCSILSGKKIKTTLRLNPFKKVLIVVPSKTNRISIFGTYEEILNDSYIKNYDKKLEEERQMLEEHGCKL